MHRTALTIVALAVILAGPAARLATAQLMPKAQVANLIVKVENGVDEFRKYLDRRGDNAKDAAGSAAGRRGRQAATENQKAKAEAKVAPG